MKLIWFFEKIDKEKGGLKIRNEREDVTPDSTEIQWVIRDNCVRVSWDGSNTIQ